MKKLLFITTALVAAADPAHADPVSAVATWIAVHANIGLATAFAVAQTAVGIGLSAISSALLKPKTPGGGANISFDVQMGDDLPLSFTVGDYATAGRRKYIGSWGTNTRFITEVIEVSALPQGLAGLWVDDEPGEFVAGRRGYVSAAAAPGSVGKINEAATVPGGALDLGTPLENNRDDADTTDPRIWVKWVDGTQTAADPLLVWAFGSAADYPWTADMVGRGKSYAIVTCQYDHDTQTSYPTFLWEPQPLRLYDLRFDSTAGGSGAQRWNNPATWQPTRNPAVISYNIARGIHYGSEWIFGGRNLPAWRLPAAEWIAAANACDDTVNLSGGGTEPRYRCGMEISVDMEPASVLEELGKAANMRFAEVGGRLKPTVDLPGAAVFSFMDGDILITEGQSFSPFYPVSETFNAVGATYPERGEKWASKDAAEYIDADAMAEDGQYLPTSMTYGAAPFGRQVRRLMRAQMRDFRRMRRHQFFLPPDAYAVEPGDMVSWTSARNGYNNKLFILESVAKTPGMNVLVSLREVDPGDYDWSSSWQVPVIITAPKNPKPFAQPINGLIVEPASLLDANGTARQPAIRVRCDGDELGVTDIHIQARLPGQDVTIDTTRRFADPWRWYLRSVLADTDYQVRARLLSALTPKSVWSSWISVRTHDITFGIADLPQEVLDQLADFEAWMDGTDDDIQNIIDLIDEDMEAVHQRVTETRADLATAVDLLEQEIEDHLGLARAYTDTSILTEQIERQSGTDALAARIDELTAALVSENLLSNGDFSDGWNGWTRGGTTSRTARDETSGTPLIATMPKPFSVALAAGGSWIEQITETFEVGADDALQFRFSAGGDSGSRLAEIRVRWRDADDTQIGPEAVHPIAIEGFGIWRRIAGQLTPPSTLARSAAIRLAHTTSAGSSLRATGFEATIVNIAVAARIAELEAAKVTLENALALHKSEVSARFGANEAAISAEGVARATADQAAADRLDLVEASTGANAAAIGMQATAIADTDSAMAALDEEISARIGAAELVRDGAFARALTYWPGGLAPVQMFGKAASGYWVSTQTPAKRFLQISAGATGQRVGPAAPVMAGEILDLSFAYARETSSVIPIVHYRFRRADGTFVSAAAHGNSAQRVYGAGSGAWLTAMQTGIPVPVGAVTAEVVLLAGDGTAHCWITLVSLRRRQAVDYLVAAEISTVKHAVADPDGALAILSQTVAANYSNLSGSVSAHAVAISDRYTKAQADTAISTAINTLSSNLTDQIGQKASASTVTALINRVKETEDGLAAQANAITKTQAQTDRASAGGLLRITSEATPSGARSRISLRAEATEGSNSQSAAAYLVAESDGTSSFLVRADRFAIVTGSGANATRRAPFIVSGGDAFIDTAIIRSLSVERLKLANGSVTTDETSYTAGNVGVPNAVGWRDLQTLTYTIGRQGRQVVQFHCVVGSSAAQRGQWDMRVIRVGLTEPIALFERNRLGSNPDQVAQHAETISGQVLHAFDPDNLTGNVTYKLQAQCYFSATNFNRRFMRVLNAHK